MIATGYGCPYDQSPCKREAIGIRSLEIGTTVQEIDTVISFFKELQSTLSSSNVKDFDAETILPDTSDFAEGVKLVVKVRGADGRIAR